MKRKDFFSDFLIGKIGARWFIGRENCVGFASTVFVDLGQRGTLDHRLPFKQECRETLHGGRLAFVLDKASYILAQS